MAVESFGIIANPRKAAVRWIVPKLIEWIKGHGFRFMVSEELVSVIGFGDHSCPREELWRHVDVLVALGGDGTILAAARAIGDHDIPILGVNLGSLGFLADVAPEELLPTLEKVKRGDYHLEKRMILEAMAADQRFFALNDVVIDKGASPRIISLSTYVGDEFVGTSIADGLIIATPTGSTAYSLSAGGPIVHPGMETLIIAPICPHILANRPMVISATEVLTIEIESQDSEVKFTVDGQVHLSLQSGDRVRVRKADHSVKLIKVSNKSFYDLLRTKLKWGVREE